MVFELQILLPSSTHFSYAAKPLRRAANCLLFTTLKMCGCCVFCSLALARIRQRSDSSVANATITRTHTAHSYAHLEKTVLLIRYILIVERQCWFLHLHKIAILHCVWVFFMWTVFSRSLGLNLVYFTLFFLLFSKLSIIINHNDFYNLKFFTIVISTSFSRVFFSSLVLVS